MTVTIQIIHNQINAILGLVIILITFSQQYKNNNCLGRNDSFYGRTEFWESLRISFCHLKRAGKRGVKNCEAPTVCQDQR